jgi:hypothetical protein
MNSHRTVLATLLLAVLLVAGSAPAADKPSREPGYVDLEWIEIPADAEEIKDIDLSPVLLDLARDAEQKGDDALVQALAMVHFLRVKAFSVTAEHDAQVSQTVTKVNDQLKREDWKRLIYVKDDDETLAVSTRYDGDRLVGLMLVAYEPGDSAAFVNVVGDLDLGTLLRLAGEIDDGDLENMLEGLEDVELHSEAAEG